MIEDENTKDPKDMTASELLRWVENYTDITCRACREMGFGCDDAEVGDCEKALEFIADKIDAELAQARKEAVNESKKPMWWFRSAIEHGEDWPEPRDGEKFRDYLHRCFLPRPRFEDGEPVQSSDMEEIGALATYRVYMDGSWEFEPDKYEDETSPKLWDVQFGAKSERVKRPSPEALGADGLPVVAGETVWLADEYARYAGIGYHDSGCLCGLAGICANDALKIKRIVSERKVALGTYSDAWCPAKWLTHTPHDTQQQIDDDATMPPAEYCAVRGIDLGDDPDREAATTTMVRDLLLRQRELDKLTGGE